MRLITDNRGMTLVELMAGTALAALLLIAVSSIEISALRFQAADEKAFTAQAEATTLLDRFAQDVRQATAYTLGADGASTVTLTVAGAQVTYQLNAPSGEVLRQDQVLMGGVTALEFRREDGGRTLRATVTATSGYRLDSRATTRLAP